MIQTKDKPFKYQVGQKLWTIQDCDPVECTVLRTGRNIVEDPEYLIQPIKAGQSLREHWSLEEHLYADERDAVEEATRLWNGKHKEAAKNADRILSHITSLMLRKLELEEQQKSLDNQTLLTGYHEVPSDKYFSSVTVKTAAKLGVIGGIVSDLYIHRGGIVHLQSGKLSSATAYSGAQMTVDGGHVFSACIAGGSLCVVGSKGNMPYVDQAVVNNGGDAYLCSAVGSGFWVREPKSKLRLGCGATAVDTTIGSGAEVTIGSGASMSCCTVCSGGTLTMYGSDVYIENLKVTNGGIVRYVEDKR